MYDFHSLPTTWSKSMGLLKEFKEFAMRGNVIDMAVGIIMGTAFGKIVNSLVTDVIMPPVSNLMGGVNVKDWVIQLPDVKSAAAAAVGEAGAKAEPVVIHIGSFLQTTLDFIIVAACIFLMIRLMNVLWKKKEEKTPPPELSTEEKLLIEIRDLLKTQQPR